MPEDAPRYRGVRYEPSWEQDLDRLRAGQPPPAPVDEVISDVEPVLSRIADLYPLVADSPFRVLNIVSARGLPALTVWFRIESDECVACLHLEEAPVAAEEDEGSSDDDEF